MHLPDEAATRALGARLARVIEPGLVLFLHGELGSGKTTLARGLLRGLGYQGRVKSPTYTLVELYTVSRLDLYHFDCYRFKDPKEWRDAGFNEYFNDASVCLVEWPEKAAGQLPAPTSTSRSNMAPGALERPRAGNRGKACFTPDAIAALNSRAAASQPSGWPRAALALALRGQRCAADASTRCVYGQRGIHPHTIRPTSPSGMNCCC